MARRGNGEINAGSMADIAFLLLIFFLVTTTMDVDSGIARKLPEKLDDTPQVIIKEKNVLDIVVNRNNQLLIENEFREVSDIKQIAIDFIDNGGNTGDFDWDWYNGIATTPGAVLPFHNTKPATGLTSGQPYHLIFTQQNNILCMDTVNFSTPTGRIINGFIFTETGTPLQNVRVALESNLVASDLGTETMDEMMERLTIYGGVLPRQARWEAELVVADLFYAERMTEFFAEVESIEHEIDQIEENFDQITELVLDAPDLVEAERKVIMKAIDDQIAAVLAKIDAERIAVTNDLSKEREAALGEIEAMSLRLLDASSATVNDAIDHFYRRAAILLAVLVMLGVAAGVVTLRLTRNLGRAG